MNENDGLKGNKRKPQFKHAILACVVVLVLLLIINRQFDVVHIVDENEKRYKSDDKVITNEVNVLDKNDIIKIDPSLIDADDAETMKFIQFSNDAPSLAEDENEDKIAEAQVLYSTSDSSNDIAASNSDSSSSGGGSKKPLYKNAFQDNDKIVEQMEIATRMHNEGNENAKGIHLITTFFRGDYKEERFHEILSVLTKNLENPLLAKVHVLWEDEDPSQYYSDKPHLLTKLQTKHVESQPTYEQLFRYSNSVLYRGSIGIIANGDIYFDNTLKCVKPVTPSSPYWDLSRINGRKYRRPFFSLTRRHAPECGSINDYKKIHDLCDHYIGSHDIFIYAAPVPEYFLRNVNHTQNIGLGAENVVIWELNHHGYRGLNPCDMINSIHMHCSQERHYSRKDKDGTRLIFYSSSKYSPTGVRRHGYIKPYFYRKTVTCPYELW